MLLANLLVLSLIFGFLYLLKYKNLSLSFRILISLILGISYGLFFKWLPLIIYPIIKEVLYLIGHVYLNFLKMLVVPLILTSIVHTILNLGNHSLNDIKKISFLTCGLLLGFTALASFVGMIVGKFFMVGAGLSFPEFTSIAKPVKTNLTETLLGMLPVNPFASMAHDHTVAIVIFAVLFGVAARLVANQGLVNIEIFKNLVAALFAIVKKLTSLILELTPYGIFALISLLLLDKGIALFISMFNFVLAMYAAMTIMFLIHALFLMLCGYHPWSYLKNAYAALLVAFTTRSSFGTVPIAEEILNKKFKTNQIIATFVPSIGATIGMNACAGIFPAMLVVMTLTILHQPITWELMLMVMFINTLASLGISGIPGTAYIAAGITLTSLNLPYAIIALVQGIDPIIDMGRTAINVNGAMTTALVIDRLITVPVEEQETAAVKLKV